MAKWILLFIVALGFLLRVIGLSSHPAGFTPDEASFGYDAYSLLQTGRDQWGDAWPLVLESFGDSKMPLYTYLAMPSVAVFGLNEFAVRLPNAILGALAIWVTYLLVLEVFKNLPAQAGKKAALIASLLLAISAWHIPMSRGAFEANLTTFLLPLSLLFYFKSKKDSKYLSLAAIIAGLNIFSYHSARFVTPLLFASLLLFNIRKIKKDKQFYIAGTVTVIVVLLVVVTYLQGAGSRVVSSGIFSLGTTDQRYLAAQVGANDLFSRFFYNKPIYIVSTFFKNYLSYFSPGFLFVSGAAEFTYGMVAGKALLYLGEAILLASFFVMLVKKGVKDYKWLIVWILIAPIPAALTIGPGSAANRAVVMLPALQIMAALGAIYISSKNLVRLIFVSIIISFVFFFHSYLYLQPAKGSASMIYGAKQAFEYTDSIYGQYSQIVVSKKLSEPHIFAAFYSRIDPQVFQEASNGWNYKSKSLGWVDQLDEYKLGKYVFKSIDWKIDSRNYPNSIFLGSSDDFSENVQPIYTVNYPDGKSAYFIVTNKIEEFASR